MKTESQPTSLERVEAYIGKHGGCTRNEIASALKAENKTVDSSLALLKRRGVIESRGIRGKMRYRLRSLSSETSQPVFGLSANMALFNRLLAGGRAESRLTSLDGAGED